MRSSEPRDRIVIRTERSGADTQSQMDVDFQHVWVVGLALGGATAIVAFAAGRFSTRVSAHGRRLLFALTALTAFVAAILVGLTGIFFAAFSGYCEDAGYCEPEWWIYVGLLLFGVAIGLGGLMGKAVQEYRRVTQPQPDFDRR
jgi:MFS family permease